VLCLSFVFLSFVYSILRVSLDCPFLISPSLFFNLYIVVDLLNSSYHSHFKFKQVEITCTNNEVAVGLLKPSNHSQISKKNCTNTEK
jgi:hypothetical protein